MNAQTSSRRAFLQAAGLASVGALGLLALPIGQAAAEGAVSRRTATDSIADQASATLKEWTVSGADPSALTSA